MSESNEMVLANRNQSIKLYDENGELDLVIYASVVARAGLYGVKSANDALVRIVTGKELGLSVAQALQWIYVVNGVPAPLPKAKLAIAKKNYPNKKFVWIESTNERATLEITHEDGRKKQLTWTIEDAKLAGLTSKDNWKHYPANCLRGRVSSFLIDMELPEFAFPNVEEMGAVLDGNDNVIEVKPIEETKQLHPVRKSKKKKEEMPEEPAALEETLNPKEEIDKEIDEMDKTMEEIIKEEGELNFG